MSGSLSDVRFFDVEDAVVAPVLVIVDETALGVGRERGLSVPLRPKTNDEAAIFLSAVAAQCIESTPCMPN